MENIDKSSTSIPQNEQRQEKNIHNKTKNNLMDRIEDRAQ
jgi:hypothetical protein